MRRRVSSGLTGGDAAQTAATGTQSGIKSQSTDVKQTDQKQKIKAKRGSSMISKPSAMPPGGDLIDGKLQPNAHVRVPDFLKSQLEVHKGGGEIVAD